MKLQDKDGFWLISWRSWPCPALQFRFFFYVFFGFETIKFVVLHWCARPSLLMVFLVRVHELDVFEEQFKSTFVLVVSWVWHAENEAFLLFFFPCECLILCYNLLFKVILKLFFISKYIKLSFFYVFLDNFNVLISKIKKYLKKPSFYIFSIKKYF